MNINDINMPNIRRKLNNFSLRNNSNIKFPTEYDFIIYFHTSIRNVGLFTSIAIAALSTGRIFGKENATFKFRKIYSAIIFIMAIIFVLMAMRLGVILIEDYHIANKQLENNSLDGWLIIPNSIFYVNCGLLIVSVGSLIQLLLGHL